ncbi:MAG TPA: amidohydrolase family protein [Candidatus Dormibacteraeota bacterium]|nr:amidohydrolase family protein [Candidatus Dormibacteraeota bacterium]
MRIVDTHFHWYPRAHFERLRGRNTYPRVERHGDDYVYLYNQGRSNLRLPPVWFDLDAALDFMDRTGHDTTVVCTTGVLSGLVDQLPPEEAVDVAAEYNEQMATMQQRHPGRFYGTAMIPLQDTGEAIRLVNHAVNQLHLRAVNLPAVAGSDLVDVGRLEPFYAEVERLGVPLIVHPTDILYGEVLHGYEGAVHLTIGRLLDSSLTVLRLIFGGVLERHPALNIIHTHAGGLLPYQAGRIDKNSRSVTGLSDKPSAYLKRMFVDTVAPQALTIRTAVEFYGAERVVYGTDYPCWDPLAALRVMEEAQLSPEQEAMVFARNAEAVLGLGVPAAR